MNPLREICRVDRIATSSKKYASADGVDSHWYSESAEVSGDAPTLYQIEVTPSQAMSGVPVTFELAEDSDIAVQVGRRFADSKDQLEARNLTIGNGVDPNPKGLVTALHEVRNRRPSYGSIAFLPRAAPPTPGR